MRPFWSDPYLWVHLAGLAAVPIFLELCLVGFTIGDPVLPAWVELGLIGAIGALPILWMQWQRPFYIFSLLAIALKPEYLTEDQCRLLTQFQAPRQRILTIGVVVLLLLVLRQVYDASAIAAVGLPFADRWRGLGLLVAAIGFLGCNLFVQVPVSVASVMLTGESTFAATTPFPLSRIRQHFSLIGLPVSRILPPITPPSHSTLAEVAELADPEMSLSAPPEVLECEADESALSRPPGDESMTQTADSLESDPKD